MFGLKTLGVNKPQLVPAMKPTRFMTNSMVIGNEMKRDATSPISISPW